MEETVKTYFKLAERVGIALDQAKKPVATRRTFRSRISPLPFGADESA